MTSLVSVLFVRKDSVYKTLPDVDVWDAERDARLWAGGNPIVVHPPCAQWSRLYKFARHDEDEKQLAIWAVGQVRKWGGVLEHPYKSRLWSALGLPERNARDKWEGYTLAMPQFWFGHPAMKASWFYIVGCPPLDLPPISFKLGQPEFTVATSKRNGGRKEMKKSERTRTYLPMAQWLVATARKCESRKSCI